MRTVYCLWYILKWNQSTAFGAQGTYSLQKHNANKIISNWIRASLWADSLTTRALSSDKWGSNQRWLSAYWPPEWPSVHWHLTQPAYSPHWSLMSADGGDHHPLFSLGAVGRVHTGQASLSPSTQLSLGRDNLFLCKWLKLYSMRVVAQGFPSHCDSPAER